MEKETRRTLRLHPSLEERIKRLAEREHRSLNGQLVEMLEYEAARRERERAGQQTPETRQP